MLLLMVALDPEEPHLQDIFLVVVVVLTAVPLMVGMAVVVQEVDHQMAVLR
jgi:hypothetical protein